jgi:hypothetical protein
MSSDDIVNHRVDTCRAVTGRRKRCGNLRFHVPTFFRRPDKKKIKKKLSTARSRQVPRAVKANRHPMGCMHASSNLPST